jgi:nitroreductase
MEHEIILKLIVDHRSIRSFDAKPVEPEKISKIFEAARWAPSSYNRQPWRFIYASAEQKEMYNSLFALLNPSNQNWAQDVPLLILSIAECFMNDRMIENRFAFHDTGMAVANMLTIARAMGLEVHPLGGYDKEKSKTVLHIPEGFEPLSLLVVGYRKSFEEMNNESKEFETKSRIRKEIR